MTWITVRRLVTHVYVQPIFLRGGGRVDDVACDDGEVVSTFMEESTIQVVFLLE